MQQNQHLPPQDNGESKSPKNRTLLWTCLFLAVAALPLLTVLGLFLWQISKSP